MTRLYLIDGATGEPIASRAVGKKQLFGVSPPLERAPEELRPKLFADYTDEEREFLRERFIALPEEFWAESVSELMGASN